MAIDEAYHELVGLFIETARAHHEATGGINPQWAEWYAEHLVQHVNDLLRGGMTIDELAAWLTSADRRYRVEGPEVSWPKAYASWLLEEAD